MQQLRLCTWNIHMGFEMDKICRALKGPADFSMLDIMAIQEASIHNSKEDAKLIAQTLGSDFAYHRVLAQTPKMIPFAWNRDIRGLPMESALIWNTKKITFTKFDVVILPPYAGDVKLSLYGKAIKKISTTQQRICIVAEGKFHSHSIRLYVLHFDVVGPVSKAQQFEAIIADSKKRKKVDLEILAGDLNTYRYLKRPRWAKLINVAEQENFMELTSNIHWTFADRKFPYKQKIDAIFVRYKKPIEYNSWSLDIPGSDHLPVFANLTLP